MRKILQSKNWIPVCAGMTLLTGCNGIGDGSTLESLEIQPVDGFTTDSRPERPLRMYPCLRDQLELIGTFTDGTPGSFAHRASWTSSNPAALQVITTDDVPFPEASTSRFARGVLIMDESAAPQTVTVTGSFAGKTASIDVLLRPMPAFTVTPNPAEVGVGAQQFLGVQTELDGRPSNVSGSVRWDFVAANDAIATILTLGSGAGGRVTGIARDNGAGLTARATFGACSVTPTGSVRVGDIVAPMTLTEEVDFTTDQRLAVNSNELLKITAGLDFDGDQIADGSNQDLSRQISLAFTDSCTLREFDASVPTTNCKETATTCANTVLACSSSVTTCPSGMTACRLEALPMSVTGGVNRIVALSASAFATNFTATFPSFTGTATTLVSGVSDTETTLMVTALSGYPTALPWDAVLDATGVMEIVRVTAVSGTTLTVTRGVGGTTAAAHSTGASFSQRTFGSNTVPITADARTLNGFTIDTPVSATLNAFATLQLQAAGTFVDPAGVNPPRTQRVTRLSAVADGSPTVTWSSSDTSIVAVSAGTGLVTSVNACGGTATIRARSSTSTNTVTASFDSTSTVDDDACTGNTGGGDPLCHQVNVCVRRQDPLPPGTACSTLVITCPP